MKKPTSSIVAIAFAVIFTIIFHNKPIGLNLFLFESLIIGYLLLTKQFKLNKLLTVISAASVFITAGAVTLVHSDFSIAMNIIAMLLLGGFVVFPKAKSIIIGYGISFVNMLYAQYEFLKSFSGNKQKENKTTRFFKRSRIFIIPVFIIIIFIFIYSKSNPVFESYVGKILNYIGDNVFSILKDVDLTAIFTVILGLIISNIFLFRYIERTLTQINDQSTDKLVRKRKKRPAGFKMTDLKNENKAGIFLLAVLNVILLVVNTIDVTWVWFNFEWEGQTLKQFVHEGTYLLIVSILISIFIVLFFFRGNLNFYRNNTFLKHLSYTWLAQNAILAISVAIRNFWYINYFNLAYKRIGVIIFLILTIYGLFSVLWKVRHQKSSFYLFRANALAAFCILIISSAINWDSIIVRYNFNHAETSFVHLDYLSTLSDKTLPILDKPIDELKKIQKLQDEKFPFDEEFMTPDEYTEIIKERKEKFLKKWEEKGILSWNLAEHKAYKAVMEKQ